MGKSKISPIVSVVMPAYNAERTIIESINSVIDQTFENWELIVVNDCSTDSTIDKVKTISLIDSRVRLFNQPSNLKVAEARNRGIVESQGEYIAFLDSDDKWKTDKLEKQLNFMLANNHSFTYTNTVVIDENNNEKGYRIAPNQMDYKDLLKSNHIACLTVMLKRDLALQFPMKNIGHEDYLTWLEITKSGINAYNVNDQLGYYRILDDSLSSSKFRAAKWQWNIYRKEQKLKYVPSIYYFVHYVFFGLRKTR